MVFHLVDINAAEFHFSAADGLKIMIYDGNVEPEKNRLLSAFHNTDYIIDGEGYLTLGALGKLKISGLTTAQATDLLYEKLKPYGKDLQLIVIPQIRLVIRGEFGKPGMYRFSPATSFWDAIMEAGGMSSSFVVENMYIIRNGEIAYADFENALYAGVSLRELGLESGDEIVAPRLNRISFASVMRWVNFFASIVLLYYTIANYNQKD